MKVAINARFLLPRLEGVGHYTYHLIDHLSASHPEDQFHIILDRDVHLPIFDRDNIARHVLSPPARHPILWYYWFEYAIPSLIRKIQPDVFFSPDGYLSLKAKIPTVMTIHDLAYLHYPRGTKTLHRMYLKKFIPLYLNRADRIVCVSKFTAQDVINFCPTIENIIEVIPNGVSPDFKPINDQQAQLFRDKWTNGRPYFLYLGAVHPRKNVRRLIKAFELYKEERQEDCCLVVAGRMSWDAQDVQQAIRLSRFKDSIIRIEHVQEEIVTLIGAAVAMCYVSLFEGFGLPVLEALACGTPVVTSVDSAMQEVCGEAALYVDPNDEVSIAKALVRVRNEQVKKDLIRLGNKRSRIFKWSDNATEIYNVIQDIVNT